MSRKLDPNTKYRVRIHKDRGHMYASVQETTVSPRTGRKYPKTINLGTLDENLAFTPNATFRLLSPDERAKYVFPDNWDISKLEGLRPRTLEKDEAKDETIEKESLREIDKTACEAAGAEKAIILPEETLLGQYSNKMYGAFWLLEQVARHCGLYDDLLQTFDGNVFKTHEVMSLAFFPYLSGQNYCRFAKWQAWNKTLLDYELKPSAITRLAQSITDSDRMNLAKLRIARQPDGARLDCDSTSRSAWGKCLADIRWGKNKDNAKLKNTVEVVVYSLATQEPIYYRGFPGNISDMSTVRTILADLAALGIDDVVFIADRGYASRENIASLASAEIPFLVCSKTSTYPVVDLLEKIEYDRNGLPVGMQYDPSRRLYYSQANIERFTGKLPDGTPVSTSRLKANLFMSPANRMRELSDLREAIEAERTELAAAKDMPKSIKRYNALFDYFKVTLKMGDDKKPIGIQYEECTDKIRKEQATCGFFSSLMYDMSLTSSEALRAYKERDEHEKNFDQMKNQMHFRVQRSSSEGGKNGMSFILFVGLIVISKLRKAWSSSMRDDYVSTLDMLDEMAPVRFCEYANGSTHMTSFTMKQVNISRACNVEPPSECIPKVIRGNMKKQDNNPNES